MNTYKLLSIDETGKASFGHLSKYFILCGVIIDESRKQHISRLLSKVKVKFFGDSEITLHGRDIFRKSGTFSKLKDPIVEIRFWTELINIINDEKISFITTIVNKEGAKSKNWRSETILNRSYKSLLGRFRSHLLKARLHGKIVVESDTHQDYFLLRAHHYHQARNSQYRKFITSLSYVTKGNQDSDVELADSLALITRYYYENKNKVAKFSAVEKMKLKLVRRKIALKTNPSYLISLKMR